MNENIPVEILNIFKAIPEFDIEYDHIHCMMNLDIIVYSAVYSTEFNIYQATTFLNTNYVNTPQVIINKLS